MQPGLVSFLGEREQRGITWGGTLTDGLAGGTRPEAPALTGASAMTTRAETIPAAAATTVRVNDLDTDRAPVRCGLTIPFAPLVARTWISRRNLTFSIVRPDGPPVPFRPSGPFVADGNCPPVASRLPVADGACFRRRGQPVGGNAQVPRHVASVRNELS